MADESGTRIDDATARTLLVPHESVRDPLHGDIWISALERALIDTPAFQRLRGISQLGPTHVVYPGAVHTRFLHSLGTVHAAENLVETVNKNCEIYSHAEEEGFVRIKPYPHLLVRLCALLHDLAHIPFGHTLEDEGNLGNPEWEDTDRAAALFGEDAAFSLVPAFDLYLGLLQISPGQITALVKDVQSYVTLCADLLDYVERDSYFCGLRERSGDRVVKHVAVLRLKERPQKPRSSRGVQSCR